MLTKIALIVFALLCYVSLPQALVFRNVYNLSDRHAPSPTSPHAGPEVLVKRTELGTIRINKVPSLIQSDQLQSNLTSYTVYVTTNQSCNSHMFGWYFHNDDNPDAPVLLWLQGGPGASSMLALFLENGPFVVQPDLSLKGRPYSWTNKYSVLYVDNPVGTGFSYTDNRTECYAHSVDDSVNQVYTFLKYLFTHFIGDPNRALFITGESYGGKYVPALADHIIRNPQSSQYFTFKGIAVGNGWIDPINQMDLAPLLYQIGLVDDIQRNNLTLVQKRVQNLIQKNQWLEAFNMMNYLIDGDLGQKSLFTQFTGMDYYLNFLYSQDPLDTVFIDFLNKDSTRNMIGVGNVTFSDGHLVEWHMRADVCQSVRGRLEHILNAGYQVMLYNGQLDVIVAPVFTERMISQMRWKGKNKYDSAGRAIWRVNQTDDQVAGYIRSGGGLTFAVIRDAGHLAPHDQPRASWDLISRFVDGVMADHHTYY